MSPSCIADETIGMATKSAGSIAGLVTGGAERPVTAVRSGMAPPKLAGVAALCEVRVLFIEKFSVTLNAVDRYISPMHRRIKKAFLLALLFIAALIPLPLSVS